jgi:hypothetical protein
VLRVGWNKGGGGVAPIQILTEEILTTIDEMDYEHCGRMMIFNMYKQNADKKHMVNSFRNNC